MRAVVFGLIGAVLAVGGAEAGACRLDGASLVAKSQARWSSELARPDLNGQTFRIERIASRWRAPKVSETTILVRSGESAFVVRRISDFSGPPVDTVLSVEAADPAVQSVPWGKRAPDAEQAHFSGVFEGIASGPLVQFDLTAQRCT